MAWIVQQARDKGAVVASHDDQTQCNAIRVFDRPKLVLVTTVPVCNAPLAESRPVRLLGRNRLQCGWIVGDVSGAETLCCGGAIRDGRSYCSSHARLAYRPQGA